MNCNISELHLEEHVDHVISQWESIVGTYASSKVCEKKYLKDSLGPIKHLCADFMLNLNLSCVMVTCRLLHRRAKG